jgi:DNA/RNA endonuclease G (NUC1)
MMAACCRSRAAVRLLLVLLWAGTGAACASTSSATVFSRSEFFKAEAIDKVDENRIADNCPFGAPEKLPGWPLGLTELVSRDGYVLEHSVAWKVPYWVCESLEADELGGRADRVNAFRSDPLLKVGQRAELSDYKGSGFDRGHMAPAGNQSRDARLKAETFYLSNMVPQVGAHNQQLWRELEDLVRSWAEDGVASEVRVITGPVFHSEGDVEVGFSIIKTIGKNGVGAEGRLQDRRRPHRIRASSRRFCQREPRLQAAV